MQAVHEDPLRKMIQTIELLAVGWAVTRKSKEYFLGLKFVSYTDSNPLVDLKTAKLGAVEQRWAAELANFNFEVRYRPGVNHGNADALSRKLPSNIKIEDVDESPTDHPILITIVLQSVESH